MSDTVRQLLDAGRPADVAIAAPGRHDVSFEILRAEIGRLAGALAAAGIGRGDRVATVLPNGPEAAVAFLAVTACATAAPLNPAYRHDEFQFAMSDLGVKALITAPGGAPDAVSPDRLHLVLDGKAGGLRLLAPNGTPLAPAPAAPPRPDDVALLLHTSGTTARPKSVPLSQRNLAASARNVAGSLALGPADRCLNVMPLFHIHGLLAGLLAPLSAGGAVACPPGFDAFRFFDWLAELRPSWYTGVPTMHQLVLSRAGAHTATIEQAKLRFIRSSSAALPPSVMAELERTFGAPVIEAYGMTEASHQMASNPLPPLPRKPGSVGVPAGVEIAILGDDLALVAAGGTGEVAIRGPSVTAGYEANPDANAASFVDGWFRTGDQGYLDPDGYLFLTGRLKELINRGGEKISPREVDEVLLTHPAVAQAVTFAVPDERLGEAVAAAVVLRPDAAASPAELRAHAAERLAPFKVPRQFVVVDALPTGPTGKVQRIGMAQRLGLVGK